MAIETKIRNMGITNETRKNMDGISHFCTFSFRHPKLHFSQTLYWIDNYYHRFMHTITFDRYWLCDGSI